MPNRKTQAYINISNGFEPTVTELRRLKLLSHWGRLKTILRYLIYTRNINISDYHKISPSLLTPDMIFEIFHHSKNRHCELSAAAQGENEYLTHFGDS